MTRLDELMALADEAIKTAVVSAKSYPRNEFNCDQDRDKARNALASALAELVAERAPPKTKAEELLPHAYLFAKIAMVMPLFEEARDALPAITLASAKLHGVRLDLGDRMDIAGTYSIEDWAQQDNRRRNE